MTVTPEDDFYKGQFSCKTIIEFIKNSDTPVAILAENDIIAKNLYRELLEHHINIPNDVELLGYGNDFWGGKYELYDNLPISTVNVPRKAMGQKAAEMLYKKMQQPDLAVQHLALSTKIIHRKTTRG